MRAIGAMVVSYQPVDEMRRRCFLRRRDLLGPAAGVDQSAFEEIGQRAVWPRRLSLRDLLDGAAERLPLDPTHGVKPTVASATEIGSVRRRPRRTEVYCGLSHF